ncbi:DUF3696 domain-containing protein [Sphingobacterium sp. LRF_L2]|uniref:DUF3696 domain-containing protein n=1 Tax=Sphingobacterium sp. LRF_L2 TaxID=3369421 RepID=UPI003F63247B
MINKIRLVNFKSHKDTLLDLGHITILSGQNGVGKSSIIQSLLLLRQTHEKHRLHEVLELNRPLCFVGRANDVLYRFPNEEFENQIRVVLADEAQTEFSWIFEDAGNQNATYLKRTNDTSDSEGYENLSLFGTDFQYLSAYRNIEYITDDYEVEVKKQISLNEGKGELVAHFLSEFGNKIKVLPGLKHESEADDFLLSQVSAWEREISANVNVIPVKSGDSHDIRYSFNVHNSLGPVDELSKKNVGFGLSYVLPVIVAILSAKEGSIILIENPEAHIHPYGVAKLSELMCLAVQAGVQIIVETHSDHIINGTLVQCKVFEDTSGTLGVDKSNVKIYHFNRDESEHKAVAIPIEIEEGGRLKNRATGFFDQIGKDLRKLI